MGVERSSVYRWYHDKHDPTAGTVVEMLEALKTINYEAAEEFVQLYLVNLIFWEIIVADIIQAVASVIQTIATI